LGEANLSRVVGRLKDLFAAWDGRELGNQSFPILMLDAMKLKVRMARRVMSVPVLVALGVDEDGEKQLVSLRLAVRESGASWGELGSPISSDEGSRARSLCSATGTRGSLRRWRDGPEVKA
jgi:transposase-like protein